MKKSYLIVILVIILLTVGGYYGWQKYQDHKNSKQSNLEQTINKISTPETSPSATISTKEFKNADHKLSLTYPESWQQKDLGGEKNVTTVLQRENIGFFYLPDSETDKNEVSSAIVSVKLLRFPLGDLSIKSQSEWYSYIKQKVDDFVADTVLSQNYQLLSLENGEVIDGKYVIVENYLENQLIQGKDYYIFAGSEMYQFVTKAPKAYADKFLPEIATIVKSWQINS